jgi:hypothetical protein
MKLPISVTGMIVHGHGNIRYAYYGLDLYPANSNHTVGSIAKVLRDLEDVLKFVSMQIFLDTHASPLFEALLEGGGVCNSSLPPPQSDSSVPRSLPPVLYIQLDSACSDNKNRYTFCFFSLLVANVVFREVYVNFMLVGHIHEDIDALFGRWSMRLQKHDYPTVPLLMKSFMDGESIPVIPHLIKEVPDFKGFIDSFIYKKGDALEGHTIARAFKFYRNPNNWPLMQYKHYCTNAKWLPKEGGGIRLWREDNEGKPILPTGEPSALAPQQMQNHSEIIKSIGGFINLWEMLSVEDSTGEYQRSHEHLIQYWKRVKLAMV